jgi:para-nitrobenzyl esterase
MPMLAGFMEYELLPGDFSFQRTLGAGVPNPSDDAAYVAALTPLYGSDAPAIVAAYPLANYPNGNWALNAIESDYGRTAKGIYIAVCSNIKSFEIARATNASPVYAYEFNDPDTPASQLATRGPVHAAELQYLFPTTALAGASQGLSEAMIAYWSNFIRSGKPNGQGLATWPAYAKPTDVMQLVPGAVSTGKDVNANHKCGFWNSLGFAL